MQAAANLPFDTIMNTSVGIDKTAGAGIRGTHQRHGSYRAERQDFNFDISIGLFQIAIVLASVSILSASRLLFYVSAALALIACLLSMNGFFLLAPIG